jgi:hypothetical protein
MTPSNCGFYEKADHDGIKNTMTPTQISGKMNFVPRLNSGWDGNIYNTCI